MRNVGKFNQACRECAGLTILCAQARPELEAAQLFLPELQNHARGYVSVLKAFENVIDFR